MKSCIRESLLRPFNIVEPVPDISKRAREIQELRKYDPPLEHDDLDTHGVLLSDEIEHYVNKCKLIDPFEKENLKPAAYELRVGYEYSMGGRIKKLSPETGDSFIRVPPFHVVVIKTMERVNLPRFLIARWNIRVRKAYEGLLWVGGPQVDPGYVGYLSCPIYNLSNKDVLLTCGEAIAVIDFVKTTPFKKKEIPSDKGCKEYPRPPSRVLFEEYLPQTLQSALVTEAVERVDNIEKKVIRVESYISIAFVAITILFAALTIFVTEKGSPTSTTQGPVHYWMYLSLAFSMLALSVAIFTRRRLLRDTVFKVFIVVWLALLTAKVFGLYAWLYCKLFG